MDGWKGGLKKDGRFWRYRFLHRGQLQTGTTKCEKKEDAKRYVEQLKARLALGEVGIRQIPTVAEAFQSWLMSRSHHSQAHLKRADRVMRIHVLPYIGAMKADQVRSEVVEQLIRRYMEGQGPHGRSRTLDGANVVLTYVRSVIRHVVDRGYLRQMPFKVRKQEVQRKTRQYVKFAMVPAFLAKVREVATPHALVAIQAMLYMGLREGEALGMRWAWLDEAAGTYTVGRSKGKEAQSLPVPPQLMRTLQGLPRTSEWVLPAEDGQPHRAQFTRKAILAAGKAVGEEHLTPHRLRATFATLLAQRGTSPYDIQTLLRHKQLSTTVAYVQTEGERLRDTVTNLWKAADAQVAPVGEAAALVEREVETLMQRPEIGGIA